MPHVEPTALPELLSTLQSSLHILLGSLCLRTLDPQAMCELERSVHALFAWAADTFFATFLFCLLEHTDFEARAIDAKRAHSPHRLRIHQRKTVKLTLLAGHVVTLKVRALRMTKPRRFRTNRGKARGHHATPTLQILGVVHRRSAAVCMEMLQAVTSLESYQKAGDALARRGLRVSTSSLHKDFELMGQMAYQAHEYWLENPGGDGPLGALSAANRRVVIGFDGGRLRERVNKRGRPRSNGYSGFHANWVEPRQLVLYAIDSRGKMDPDFGKVVLASLDAPDKLFGRIINLFKALNMDKACEVVISADGQHWQWTRMLNALEQARVEPCRVTQVLDLGHALGRLSELSHLAKTWSQARQVRWYLKGKKLLKAGQVEQVQDMCQDLIKGRRSKVARSLAGYFQQHRERMRYASFRARGLPCGSGMVESMIRQVINLRLKGCGKFWKRDNAEQMMLLRGWQVTGRLEALWMFTLRRRIDWWYTSLEQQPCANQTVLS